MPNIRKQKTAAGRRWARHGRGGDAGQNAAELTNWAAACARRSRAPGNPLVATRPAIVELSPVPGHPSFLFPAPAVLAKRSEKERRLCYPAPLLLEHPERSRCAGSLGAV
ncbi:hypothetical protein MRX96_012230 [Rhipicephalus microplus]